MENQENYFSDLKQDVQSYINDRILLVKLKAIRSAAAAGGMLGVVSTILFLSFFFLLFSGLTLGFWLAPIINSAVGAFAIVLVFYVLIIVLLIVLKKKAISAWVTRKMITNILGSQNQVDSNATTNN
jgi:hypothetical protein